MGVDKKINHKKVAMLLVCLCLIGYMVRFHQSWVIQAISPSVIFQQNADYLLNNNSSNTDDTTIVNDDSKQIESLIMEACAPVLLYNYNYGTENNTLYVSSQVAVNDLESSDDASHSEQSSDADVQTQEASTEAESIGENDTSIPVIGIASLTGSVYTREQLSDFQFMLDHCYVVDSTTYVDENEMNADTLLSMDMTMQQDNSDYQILIYHTHSSSETFADSRPGVLEDTTIGLGDTLTELLEGYGYKVYHDRTVYDQIDGKVDRNYAYTAAGEGIDKILEEHPSIEVIIDLHRDGVDENTHLVTEINGKPTAKIMFFNGVSRTVTNGELEYLENPNRQANLAFSLQLYLAGEAAYDDFLRNIYIKGYQYNLDRRPKATLIEVGGQTNTVEEANNAMEPLAYILNEVLSGENQ